MSALVHSREGEADLWKSEKGQLRMWKGGPHLVLSEASGHFDIGLGRAFIGYFEPLVVGDEKYTGLHDWSRLTGYDSETRKLFTRWTELHRRSFHRIVIFTESRIVRMGIATAKLVLGSIVEAVGTRAELNALISEWRK